jgi:hypothetical protein
VLWKFIGIEKYRAVHHVKSQRLMHPRNQALFDLYDEIRRIEAEGRDGVLIEAGCGLGALPS